MKVISGGEVKLVFNDHGDIDDMHVSNFHFNAEGISSRKEIEIAMLKFVNNAARRKVTQEIKKLG